MSGNTASLVQVNSDNAGDDASQHETGDPAPEDTTYVLPAGVAARFADSPAMRAAIDLANSPAFRAAAEAARNQQRLVQDLTNSPAMRVAADLAKSPAFRAAAEAVDHRRRLLRDLTDSPAMRAMADLANSPALRAAAEAAAIWHRYAELGAEIAKQAMDAIRPAVGQIWPGIVKAAAAAGKTLVQIYRAAAPPNWTADESAPLLSYPDAVNLALEEGIPLAWVPDPETVRLLMAIPKTAPERSSALRKILDERSDAILEYCQARLNEIVRHPSTPEDRKRMAEVALQSIQALRAGLPAPAQSAAANLTDQLLRRLITPIDGKYAYRAASRRVAGLSSYLVVFSWSFLAILRELATLMPVPKALMEWWPDQGIDLPETFSRHATAHAIAEPDQVNAVNALIAIMLSVSLLCQETASDWTALRTIAWNPSLEISA